MNSEQLLKLCSSHPTFDMERFVSEGRKMKEFGVLDQFYELLDSAKSMKGPGGRNECNSWIAYWCGLTMKEPEAEFEPVERMVATRVSPPDVDVDFDYFRRQEVYDYLVNRYGEEYTCNIGTYNELKARATLRNVGKVMDVGEDWVPGMKKAGPKTLQRVDEIAKMAPHMAKTLEEAERESPILASTLKRLPEYRRICKQIQGRLAYSGVHAAGIIVSNRRVRELAPLKLSHGTVCSQFDKDELEEIGLLKFDILALKTLSVIDNTLKLVRDRIDLDLEQDRDFSNLEPDDPEVFKMLNAGITKGIFQMEGRGITELLKAVHVDGFEDMVATNAIFRPGPLGANVHELYCALKHGREEVSYAHPSMKEALEPTYGLIVYQEQVMQISKDLCGFTGPQADKLRKAVGKKDEALMAQMKDKFVKGAMANGVKEAVAYDIWAKIEKFGGYGFNRSHAACYAYIAYQTAWLKRYYTVEFMCCLLSAEIGNDDKIAAYISEAKTLGMRVFGPDINSSGLTFSIEVRAGKACLRAPLTYIKGVGEKAVRHIVERQPYKSLRDFVTRNNAREVTSKVVELLIQSGCFVSWDDDKRRLAMQYEALKAELKSQKADPSKFSSGGLDFFRLKL